MENRGVCAILIGVASLSLLFQAIGLFAPSWLIFDLKFNSEDTKLTEKVGLGLFAGHGCVDVGYGEQCSVFTMDMLSNAITQSEQSDANKSAANQLLGNFLPLQVLTIFGGLASVVALILLIAYARSDPTAQKGKGVVGACLWIVAGIFLIAAVGYSANQYSTFKMGMNALSKMPEISDSLQMNIHFPWAVAMTGMGALFALIDGLILSIKLCHARQSDGGIGSWNKFSNQAI